MVNVDGKGTFFFKEEAIPNARGVCEVRRLRNRTEKRNHGGIYRKGTDANIKRKLMIVFFITGWRMREKNVGGAILPFVSNRQ